MVAVSMLMRCRPCSFRHKDVLVAGLLALTGTGLMSCASTQELYAQYDQQFCPVDGVGVVVPASTHVQKNGEHVDIGEVPDTSDRAELPASDNSGHTLASRQQAVLEPSKD